MKESKMLAALIVMAVILTAVWFLFSSSPAENKAGFTAKLSPTETLVQTATLVIDDGSENPQSFEIGLGEESTPFDLLQESGLSISHKNYDMGVFIEAIGDKKNGDNGKYWLYYVNGEMPMVAADKQAVQPGDKVEFRFEKSPF